MTIRNQIAALESPVARELLSGLCDAFEDAIFVPNSVLPKNKQGHKEYNGYSMIDGSLEKVYGRSLASLNRELETEEADLEIIREQEQRLQNLEKYIASNVDINENLYYDDVNERLLNNAEIAFVNVMQRIGVIE